MGCNFVSGPGFNGFQCNPGNYDYLQEQEKTGPYDDGECRHARQFDNKGILTCQDCCATYNENTLEWENAL